MCGMARLYVHSSSHQSIPRANNGNLEVLGKMRSANQLSRRSVVVFLLLFVFASSLTAFQNPPTDFRLTDDMKAALARISPTSMREHLKFIASDELQGRNTPSPGLDRAAEYIAAQFKKVGLEAVG